MRIISGRFRGRTITAPRHGGIRPATDRVRESIFNILQNRLDISGIGVLDLFAGTGSLGFEAISRGAAVATFVDESHSAVGAIKGNADRLGCGDVCDVIRTDAIRFLSMEDGLFSLIFADPPYAWPRVADLPEMIHRAGILKPGGYLIMEHGRKCEFTGEKTLQPRFQRTFGSTVVSFFSFS